MTNPPGAMPPLPEADVVRLVDNEGFSDDAGYIWAWFAHGYDTGMEPYFSADTLQAYAAPLIARLAELERQNEAQKDEWLSWDSKRAALEKDAARYQWLKERLLAADFAWGEPATCVWVFETDAPISADLDASIDAAIAAKD